MEGQTVILSIPSTNIPEKKESRASVMTTTATMGGMEEEGLERLKTCLLTDAIKVSTRGVEKRPAATSPVGRCAVSAPEKKKRREKKSSRAARRRMRDLERAAASRSMRGDGSSLDLPPLPVSGGDDDGDDGGMSTLFDHPYGALPHGNKYASSDGGSDSVRTYGLGPILRRLNDEQILSCLSYLDGPSLGRAATSSRFLYAACHHDELWRDLTLRRYGEAGFDFEGGGVEGYVR